MIPARRSWNLRDGGYVLIALMIAVVVMAVLMLKALPLWQTEAQRESEAELIFRGHQYANAIGFYVRSHNNLHPQNLEILHLEKFLRRLYPDPVSADGRWDLVLKDTSEGEGKYLIVPMHMVKPYFSRAVLVGVCSTSPETGFREYRGKKKYNEGAFYFGENENEKMPELVYEGTAR